MNVRNVGMKGQAEGKGNELHPGQLNKAATVVSGEGAGRATRKPEQTGQKHFPNL